MGARSSFLAQQATASPYWWAQPVATILAASIALLAAWIAWRNVTRQIGNDRRKERRAEQLGAAVEAVAALREALFNIRQRKAAGQRDRQLGTEGSRDTRSEWAKLATARHARLEVARARLQLFDLEKVTSAFEEAYEALNLYSQRGGSNTEALEEAETAIRQVTEALAQELKYRPENAFLNRNA